jgi:beta-xylosidase
LYDEFVEQFPIKMGELLEEVTTKVQEMAFWTNKEVHQCPSSQIYKLHGFVRN